MKIAALLLTAVVVLNSVGISLQGNMPSSKCFRSSARQPSPSPSPPPSPPPRREPSPPQHRFPFLTPGSFIVRAFHFPRHLFYKAGNGNFEELLSYYDAVISYERKIVGVFLQPSDNVLFGLYYGKGKNRVKINPACIDEGPEHYDELDAVDEHYYPEFQHFEKPNEIISKSLQAYTRLGRGLSCSHTIQMRSWFSDLPTEAHIVRRVEFPQGFFFKLHQERSFHPLMLHECDVVVDPSGMIVAVFLGPSEYKLHGIYIGGGGTRVKLTKVSMEAKHYEMNEEEKYDLYVEFMEYEKPREMYRDSFEECG